MEKNTVYFVHGLWGFPAEFFRIKKTLKKAGFRTEIFAYNSLRKSIVDVSKMLMNKIKDDKPESISIVTHSMGALVVRSMLEEAQKISDFPRIYRIVMIAPPNQGAISANLLYEKRFFRFLMGVNLKHICNFPDSLSKTAPVPQNIEIGIIAGIIKNDSDGEIEIEETKLGTEKDFVTVKSHHIFILQKKSTCFYTLSFLRHGKF